MHYAYKLEWKGSCPSVKPRYSNCFPRLLKTAKTESEWKQEGIIGVISARTTDGKWKAYAYVSEGRAWDGKSLPIED